MWDWVDFSSTSKTSRIRHRSVIGMLKRSGFGSVFLKEGASDLRPVELRYTVIFLTAEFHALCWRAHTSVEQFWLHEE